MPTDIKMNEEELTESLNNKLDIDKFMPIGFVYVQFSNQDPPDKLFGGTWQDISNQYANMFFRAAGDKAAKFGSTQGGGVPNITGSLWGPINNIDDICGLAISPNKQDMDNGVFHQFYNAVKTQGSINTVTIKHQYRIDFNASKSSNIYSSDITEVRPVNSTIKIWKRTA